jgi:hypothetical protein
MLESHAARLEQIPIDRAWTDPEALARCHRTVAGLYPVDAVTLGSSRDALVASMEAVQPVPAGGPLPDPDSVATAEPARVLVETVRRLRPVLLDRVGIAIVFSSPATLCARLDIPDQQRWASRVITAWIRSFGADQPDLYLERIDGSHGNAEDGQVMAVAAYHDVPVVRIPGDPGVEAIPGQALAHGSAAPVGAWLVTTTDDVPPDEDPTRLRAALTVLADASRARDVTA